MSSLYSNVSTSWVVDDQEFAISDDVFVFGIVIIWIITFVTIFGNALVLGSFIRDEKIRSKPANVFILVMSIADLTIGLVSLPLCNIWIMQSVWTFGEIICKVYLFLDYLACGVSSGCIFLLSLDRYWMVKKNLKYKSFMTHRKAWIFAAIVISYFVIYYVVTAFFWESISGTDNIDYSEECELNSKNNLTFNIIEICVEFSLTLIVLVYLNVHVFIAVSNWSTGKSLQKSIVSKNNSEGNTASEKLESIRRSHNESMQMRKAATMLGSLVLAFLICWTPYHIVLICGTLEVEGINDFVWTTVGYVLWFNSSLNPVIYAATNVQFRKNFIEMCCGKKTKLNNNSRTFSHPPSNEMR
ncbi:beta-2 adrenergic receptor-like [Antedon mediterranea]|uniref:beta-2 adrenergic receptor-like n=1 Tax=Antedon mediterranea TaxID=105859 RepID=UPI003AF5641B